MNVMSSSLRRLVSTLAILGFAGVVAPGGLATLAQTASQALVVLDEVSTSERMGTLFVRARNAGGSGRVGHEFYVESSPSVARPVWRPSGLRCVV